MPNRTSCSPLLAACAAMLVSYLPFSAVNGTLGTIAAATGASTADLQWASDAFAAALASVALAAGALGGRCGQRRVAVCGLLLTAIGTLISDIAGVAGMPALWAGQALAGVRTDALRRRPGDVDDAGARIRNCG